MSYIVDGFKTEELASKIDASPCKKLIQELNFKYGLKVIDSRPLQNWGADNTEFYLTESTGAFVAGRVWTYKEDGNIIYNFRTPFYRKDRGSDNADRETIHSKKLSTLMATLKRQDVVPSLGGMLKSRHQDSFENAVNSLESHHGNTYKRVELEPDELHALLRKAIIGVNTSNLDINKCKELLDKYDKIDRIKDERAKDVERFFGGGFHAVGADKLGHLVIGTLKRIDSSKYEIINPFKRVKDLSEHEELQPIMLMQKTIFQDRFTTGETGKLHSNYVPVSNQYMADLDIAYCAVRGIDYFDLAWILVPCSTN